MTSLSGILRTVSWFPLAGASVVLFFLMTMTFMDVLLRSAFNSPIAASTELTRFSMAIIVFSSLPVLSGRGGHIRVDLLDGLIRRLGLDRIWTALISILCGVILWWPANRIIDLAERSRSYGDLTEYLEIPIFYIGWFIAIMTFVTMVVLIVRGVVLLIFPALWGGDD
ncbi:MAG: TRAP transporter small permease [Rhodobacteraceae bacterium]|nr:TRAP transporter small permease [Paracoccaceae bacterium]